MCAFKFQIDRELAFSKPAEYFITKYLTLCMNFKSNESQVFWVAAEIAAAFVIDIDCA